MASSNLLQNFYSKFGASGAKGKNTDPHFNFSRNYLCAMSFSFPKGIPFPTEYTLQDITLMSQAVNTPDIELSGVERESTVEIKNLGGSWTGVGEVNVQPVDNTFNISLIDTVRPVHEMFFLPWLKYVVEANRRPPDSEVGSGGTDQEYPFARAVLHLMFFNNISSPSLALDSDVALEYIIDGVFPVEIENRKMAYGEQQKLVRDVKFAFNRIDCVTLPNVNKVTEGLSYATPAVIEAPIALTPPAKIVVEAPKKEQTQPTTPPVNIVAPPDQTLRHFITVEPQTVVGIDLLGGIAAAGAAGMAGAGARGIASAGLRGAVNAQEVVVVTDTVGGRGSPAASVDAFGNIIRFR